MRVREEIGMMEREILNGQREGKIAKRLIKLYVMAMFGHTMPIRF